MDTTETTHISLCSGYGGIDLGLRRVLPNLRTVAYAEIEAFACENLLARMEGGQLDAAPIWSDLKSFPWEAFHDMVDILSGGYPCQPFSASGLRKGAGDERHLWPHIAKGIAILRPGLCFFENVEGHVTLGLRDVLQQLGELGYRSTWGIFSAAECGAAHQRKRLFILAHSVCERGQLSVKRQFAAIQNTGGQSTARRTEDDWECNKCELPVFNGCSCDHAESQCAQCGEWTYPFVWSPKDACATCGTDWPSWSNSATWPIEPTVCGGNDGSSNRVDRLRLLGNGVVPATAALAFRTLLKELTQ